MQHVAAFFVLSVVVIVTPGPDTALTIRNTLGGGRRVGIFTALGVAAGQATWTVATSAGVAALLLASEPAFRAIRLAGATYLVFLGVQTLRGARAARTAATVTSPRRPARPRAALRQGLFSNLGNPKMAAFFPSLLTQFVPHAQPGFGPLVVLGFAFCAMTLAWLTAYAVVVAKAGDALRRPVIRRRVEAVTGAVLVALGVRFAAEAR